MNDFSINFFLADSGYMTCVRLVVGAICSLADVDVDTGEDFKVCVTESCIMLKSCGFESVNISFSLTDGVKATVSGIGGSPVPGDIDFSLALISALVSSCDIEKEGEAIAKVILKI